MAATTTSAHGPRTIQLVPANLEECHPSVRGYSKLGPPDPGGLDHHGQLGLPSNLDDHAVFILVRGLSPADPAPAAADAEPAGLEEPPPFSHLLHRDPERPQVDAPAAANEAALDHQGPAVPGAADANHSAARTFKQQQQQCVEELVAEELVLSWDAE